MTKKVVIKAIPFEPVHGGAFGGYHATEQWGENEKGYFNLQTGEFHPKENGCYHTEDVMWPDSDSQEQPGEED